MKHILKSLSVAAALALVPTTLLAAEKEKEFKCEALCAKCELKQTDKCQDALRVEEGGKKVVYLIEKNDASKDLHKKICSAVIKVNAKGTVSEKDGKKWVALTKIEEAK